MSSSVSDTDSTLHVKILNSAVLPGASSVAAGVVAGSFVSGSAVVGAGVVSVLLEDFPQAVKARAAQSAIITISVRFIRILFFLLCTISSFVKCS